MEIPAGKLSQAPVLGLFPLPAEKRLPLLEEKEA
jgi:hypothetical protein